MDTDGFYKLDGELLFSPNSVSNSCCDLVRDNKDQYDYPMGGWYWFDTELEAREFFGLPPEETPPTPDNLPPTPQWPFH